MSEDYLATVESYRAYLESLPELTEDMFYYVDIVCEKLTHRHGLVLAMSDAEAIEQFDVTFLEIHRDKKGYENPEALVLVAPADSSGERREIARIDLV